MDISTLMYSDGTQTQLTEDTDIISIERDGTYYYISKKDLLEGGNPNGVAVLDGDGKVPLVNVPSIPVVEEHEIRLDGLDTRVDNIITEQDLNPDKDMEVVDARVSNVSHISYPTLGNRLDGLDTRFLDKGHIYGCRIEKATGITEPLEEAIGKVYRQQINGIGEKSDFSSVYPWSEIITVKIDKDGEHLATIDDPQFQLVVGDVVGRLPVFWSRQFETDTHEYYYISDVPRVGWQATGFYNPDGTIRPYTYVGAFPTTNDGDTPHSWYNAPPTVNKPLYHATDGFQAQALAKSQKVTWSNIYHAGHDALWLLIMIEISGHVLPGNATPLGFNVKDAIGQGINALGQAYDSSNRNVCTIATTDANTFIIDKSRTQYFFEGMMVQVGTGYTNQSIAKDRYITKIEEYDASNDVFTLDGAPFTTTTSSQVSAWGQPVPIEQVMALKNESGYVLQFGSQAKSHVCYRGIWDLWGNVYQWLSGVCRYDLEFYVCHDPAKMNVGDPREADGWLATGIAPNIPNGYLKERQFYNSAFGSLGLPKAVGGGSTTWYAAYCYYFNDGYMGLRAVRFGGRWLNGAYVGLLWSGSDAPTDADMLGGGRLIL